MRRVIFLAICLGAISYAATNIGGVDTGGVEYNVGTSVVETNRIIFKSGDNWQLVSGELVKQKG